MAKPRITGLLHNCALNSALPTLLNGIEMLAMHEASGTLDKLTDNIIVQNYLRLKNIFANHYGIGAANTDFTWGEFHAFLRKHSFYANEIIFAPVLREFIGEEGLASGNYPQIKLLKDIRRSGQYSLLATLEVASLFHNCFGISLKSYEYIRNKGTGNPEDNYDARDVCLTPYSDYPFGDAPTLKLYLKALHFEIQPHESLAESNRAYIAEIRCLPRPLAAIHNGLTVSESSRQSKRCLDDLYDYVHTNLVAQLNSTGQCKLALRECENRFNGLLGDLDQITNRLRAKAKTNPADYNAVFEAAEFLASQLRTKSTGFFAFPTPGSFVLFKGECRGLMQDAEDEFKKHRGNPLIDGIWIVIKGILGVLAALTVIPALIVEKKSKHGFIKTFFSLETESALEFAEVREDYNALEQEMGALINP
ncbi:hypothetical protein [Legionella maioricensis]|uniref:Ankyrin repeat protein n=1 Tax=Legionella maioricensis TaxID=2896528 RepID=A0A9X2IEB2_9GAMM|nr:hypothetical protein [Legionella maioricensis]MCL9685643.1 hypothetical protein [Legionella maioricensis]MCL9689052.1 hypothetical protein [Legionella maioricensis]